MVFYNNRIENHTYFFSFREEWSSVRTSTTIIFNVNESIAARQ